jgi:hypothetical protein
MKGKGYDYKKMSDPEDKYGMSDLPDPVPGEIEVAEADIQCKISTNLVGIGVAVQDAYDNQYIDKYREKLEALKQPLLDYIAGK